MKIESSSTHIMGVHTLQVPLRCDDRGGFGRVFCAETCAGLGGFTSIAQINQSQNTNRGTVRGLHFQRPPHAESKIIICLTGSVFDVVVDLRKNSPTYGQHVSVTLHAHSGAGIVVPKGCAHGFQTLEDDSRLLYLHDVSYAQGFEGGVHPLDSRLGIDWPLPTEIMSQRDRSLPHLAQVMPIELHPLSEESVS